MKLPRYDPSSDMQPLGVFMCHDARDGQHVCKGWLDVHGADELTSIRLAAVHGVDVSELFESKRTKVPLFDSGLSACVHGLRDIENPGAEARRKMDDLKRRHPDIAKRARKKAQ